jgi:gliding motility-associated-like protein
MFSAGPCVNVTDRRFQGMLDEVRIYSRAINAAEVAALYYNPDELVNRDTVIFLGRGIPTLISRTCASRFSWLPTDGISNPDSANTIITPIAAGQHYYTLTMQDQQYCSSTDAFRVTVIDPNAVDCNKVYLPKAFTPQKDGLNEEFFISNPYTINELVSFDIFDGYGAIVFSTKDKEGRWDGSMNGRPLNAGVYMWKIVFKCNGREITQFGTVMMMR